MPERFTFHWRFFLKWIGANILAVFFLGLFWSYIFPRSSVSADALQVTVDYLPFILITGIVGSGLQGAVLADQFHDRRLTIFWILAYTLGGAISFFLLLNAIQMSAILLSAALAGTVGGSLEWIVLKRYMHKAHWWILANMIGSILVALSNALSILAIIVTGFTLAWLVCDPIQQHKFAAVE